VQDLRVTEERILQLHEENLLTESYLIQRKCSILLVDDVQVVMSFTHLMVLIEVVEYAEYVVRVLRQLFLADPLGFSEELFVLVLVVINHV
jgi:hypothetical protein